MITNLEKEGEARQEELALAYPSFLARLTLLAQTGMPIRQIFARLSKEKNGVVYEEVRRTFREMESGMTQTEALERFGKRTRRRNIKVRGIAGPEHPQGNRRTDHCTRTGGRECVRGTESCRAGEKQRKRRQNCYFRCC